MARISSRISSSLVFIRVNTLLILHVPSYSIKLNFCARMVTKERCRVRKMAKKGETEVSISGISVKFRAILDC